MKGLIGEDVRPYGGDSYGYYEDFDGQPGYSDYDDPRDYREWCDWSDVEDDDRYYDPVPPGVKEEIVTFKGTLGMVADAAVVAAVLCSDSHVDLRVSEGPGLFDNVETEPEPKRPEPGEGSPLSILSDIGETDFMGPSPVVGDASDPPVSVGRIISGPSPPEPELGVILKLLDFSSDIDPGPREFFPGSESMLVRPVILDNCVLDRVRYLPESGVVPDGLGSASDCGAGSGKPFPRYGGVLSARDSWNAIENEHEGPSCEYGARLRILDCGDDTEMGDEVHWPGLGVLNVFGGSGRDPGRSFPGSAGSTMLPGVYDAMDTGHRRVSPKAAWSLYGWDS